LGISEFGSLSARSKIALRLIDVQMMRGGIAIVNEMEF
jgi:hypothetical protein